MKIKSRCHKTHYGVITILIESGKIESERVCRLFVCDSICTSKEGERESEMRRENGALLFLCTSLSSGVVSFSGIRVHASMYACSAYVFVMLGEANIKNGEKGNIAI